MVDDFRLYEEDLSAMECIWNCIPSKKDISENISSLVKYCGDISKETLRQSVCKIIRWRRTRLFERQKNTSVYDVTS